MDIGQGSGCRASRVKSLAHDDVGMTAMEGEVRTCEAGSFSGNRDSGCIEFKGIRYAESERYGPPVQYRYPEGVHECLEPSPYCIQNEARVEGYLLGIYYREKPQTESCQFLSITVPDDSDSDSGLPVMVWFHGGSYKNGGCENYVYDRRLLSREQKVAVIGVNYRLSIFGFVRDREGGLANNGLLDCIEALRWIKRNVSAFGGDPDNVTIFGQSAGADIARCIMLSEGTEELYRRAIVESAPLGTDGTRDEMDSRILEELNSYPIDATVEELRSALDSILSHVTEKSSAKEMPFGPHFGVYPLPNVEDIPKRMAEVSDHPMLIGSNTREVMAYIGGDAKLKRYYRSPLTRWLVVRKVNEATDRIFRVPVRRYAELYSQCGGTTYHYSFFWMDGRSFVGACHGAEIPLIFGASGFREGSDITMGLSLADIDETGRPIREIWAGFARDGAICSMSVDGIIDIERL